MSNRNLMAAAVAAFALWGCATAPSPQDSSAPPPPGFGETSDTAIEVCMPRGERAYLDLLQCSDGSPAAYRRVGNFGRRNNPPGNLSQEQQSELLLRTIGGAPLRPGEQDYHVVDGYEVSCGAVKRMIYTDMYHCHQAPPTEAPRGFQLRRP
jgi:hypothetical protein